MMYRKSPPKPQIRPTVLRIRDRLWFCFMASRLPEASWFWALMETKMAGTVQNRPIQPKHQNTAHEAMMAYTRPWSLVP